MKNYKSQTFRYAWTMFRATGKPFSFCLTKAWQLYMLRKSMNTGEVRFEYLKIDGTIRRAAGTLQNVSEMVKGTGSENFKSFAYFDTEAGAFRSFKVENFISIQQ